jgi:hypothetical protein
VRGKNIFVLALVLMFAGMTLNNVAFAPSPHAKIYVSPTDIPAAMPGDVISVDIMVYNVEDLYTFAFELSYAPFGTTMFVKKVIDVAGTAKEFLPNPHKGDIDDEFHYVINTLDGTVGIGYTLRVEDYDHGFSCLEDSAVLATVQFVVVDAGDCTLGLHNTALYNSDGDWISHSAFEGYYHGAYADLADPVLIYSPGRTVNLKETNELILQTTIHNFATVPLDVRARFDIFGEDASFRNIYAGQMYNTVPPPSEYLYVDEFNEWFYEWNNPPENLFGEPDGDYIEGTANAQWASLYSFEDITLAGREIVDLTLEGYTRYPNGATDAVDADVYDIPGGFVWFGSLWGTADWGWHGVRWTADSVLTCSPRLADETELNNLEILVYNYHGDAPDTIELDSMRLRVDFASVAPATPPVYTLAPGDTLTVSAKWVLIPEDIGKYYGTVYAEFSAGTYWNKGHVEKAFSLRIFTSEKP